MLRLAVAAAVLCCWLAIPAPAIGSAPDRPADPAAAIRALVERYREQVAVPGVAVTVTRGETVLHVSGYGRTAAGAPVTADTPMATASLSKSITAFAVLQLAERGRLELGRPVRDYLPEFTLADPRSARITTRQLLDQTSGMSYATEHSAARRPDTLREAVAGLRDSALAAAPGTRWQYYNPNYQVAARLIEAVSGTSYADYLHRHLFRPLGMRDSGTIDTERELPPSARGYVRVLGVPVPLDEPASFGAGSGGVLSSARDLACWLIMQRGGRTAVLGPRGLAAAHTPSAVSGDYALGWFTGHTPSGAPLLTHDGDLFTATAFQALLPRSGYGVAVLANTGSATGDAQAIGARLVTLLDGQRPAAPPGADALLGEAVPLVLAAALCGLCWSGARRARRWSAARRSIVDTVWRLLPLLVPVSVLAGLDLVAGFLYRGRSISWLQAAYSYPALVLALGVAALGCTGLLTCRLLALRHRSSG